jgi:hypothetical protein
LERLSDWGSEPWVEPFQYSLGELQLVRVQAIRNANKVLHNFETVEADMMKVVRQIKGT